jgi:hypothetical protein
MAIITITSRVRATDLLSDGWPTCCGQRPEVFTWARGMGKGLIGVRCRNPQCANHVGVLEHESEIRSKWESYRVIADADG